jgi:DNA (cytosine-5)-methyltransferase 1
VNVLDVCSGVGTASLGLRLAVGRSHRSVMYVERDAFAAACLVARMEDEALDFAPIWDDLTTLDGRSLRGVVDLVSAGLPCQPYSVAGKGAADADERALWPSLVRVVRESEPAFVFLENVPAFLKHSRGIWEALGGLGFRWAPPLLQDAHSFGAPHSRRRLFLLAAHPERVKLWEQSGGQCRPVRAAREALARIDAHEVPYADGGGRESQWCGWVFDGERASFRHDPDRCPAGCRIRGSYWDSQSPDGRVADGVAHRVDRLRAIGNVGAPPVGYAVAFLTLYRDLMEALDGEEA